jgi:hypothetical protein
MQRTVTCRKEAWVGANIVSCLLCLLVWQSLLVICYCTTYHARQAGCLLALSVPL